MRDPFLDLLRALGERNVRFVLIGVAGANQYSPAGSASFETYDRDFFLPPDSVNLLHAWKACEAVGLSQWVGEEPLDLPRDPELARKVVERRALVRATDEHGLNVDLTLVMGGFEFEAVWQERRVFTSEGVDIPVARLMHCAPLAHSPLDSHPATMSSSSRDGGTPGCIAGTS